MSDNVHLSPYMSNFWKDTGDYYRLINNCTKKSTPYSVNDVDIRPSTPCISTRNVYPISREKTNNSLTRNYGRLLDVQLHSRGNTETIRK